VVVAAMAVLAVVVAVATAMEVVGPGYGSHGEWYRSGQVVERPSFGVWDKWGKGCSSGREGVQIGSTVASEWGLLGLRLVFGSLP
jgi:hypothetical protein